MLGVYLAVIIAGILLACQLLGFTFLLLPLAMGSTAGMASGLQRCRPVHGVVPGRAHAALLAQLADAGFIAAAGAPDDERFVHKAPRWLNWDANSASIRRRKDGDFDATIPLYVYNQVRRRSVPALAL